MKKWTKLLMIVLGAAMLSACGSVPEQETEKKLEKIELSVQKTEVDVDEALEITVSTTPKDIEIQTASFQKMDGAQIEKKEKKFVFKASKAGTYSVQVKQDAIDSNVLKIKAVDPKEKAEEEEEVAEDAAQSSQETAGQETGAQENQQVIVTGNGLPHNDPTWNAEAIADTVDVSSVMADPQRYMGQTMTIVGNLPQSAADSNGKYYTALYPDTNTNEGLRLSGASIDIGGCVAELTGMVVKEDDTYVFDVQSYRMAADQSVR
ncbi:hypothetical protein [uncultured Dubosiella sp.]|uniref:hypothetical protein n=6 Tax=uncultured Dubosiella sp. TaxID=1937011 RepID=UPI00207F103D|nr:hypothetical protein [uncultured Dubosiella sp.]GJM56391.1 hypothetical protein EROP_00840 [Erysipelotrichaceae bacterium OPF54]